MEKKAIFPGSFDPFTIGHESIVRRAIGLFDNIIVAVGVNLGKAPLMTSEARVEMINEVFCNDPSVSVAFFEGLTVDFCKKVNANYMLRGIRTAADFEYERAIAQVNKKMLPNVESIFLLTNPEHTPVNSTIIRDIIRNRGDASQFLPEGIDINKYLQ
ncbi:MAG TPA: pantetheine-phosphate adenylyltransferase [Bacteroidales bacterium]|nr:pantetheine-phosphate adenylyltransferase [Bacteroidales bacterium]